VPAPEARLGRKPVKLTAAELRLPANVTLLSADPEYVELRVGQATSRSVAVEVPLSGTAPNSMMVTVNRPPAMVRLIGAEDAIRGVSSISTETLDLGTVSQPGTRRLRVVVPANAFFFSEPESVDVSVVLQKEGARIFIDVPVSSIAPTGRTVELDPATAQIAVAGPADRIDSLRLADITAQVRISGLGPGEYRLAAEIVLPPEFRLVKCEPQLFDVTVK
jgi:YbbR domain-containing protein